MTTRFTATQSQQPRAMPLLLLLAGLAQAGEVPFGHADWKASPTDPVGFAGQGNNWYPGATPPLTWSHTADGKSQNILWKVPHPGWTDAQPLVVGKRIVGVYSPHYVVCYDADTGKVLWQDELKIMTLPERGESGKPTGAVPEAALAAKRQLLFERGLAFMRVSVIANTKKRDLDATSSATRRPLVAHAVETMTAWRTDLAADFPESAKALDLSLATLNQYLAGEWAPINKAKGGGNYVAAEFWQQVSKFLKVKMSGNWDGSVSDVMACPVSDGEIVAVSLGFGQVAAYDLASGKRLWAWRDPELNPGSTSHCASPCLWKDLVLIPAAGDNKGRPSILGIDKRSGLVRWEAVENNSGGGGAVWGQGNTHGNHMSPHLMRLPGGKAILVSNMGNLIDPETGASLGQLPKTAAGNDNKLDNWGSGFISSVNGTLYKGWGGDCGAPPINAWPISLGTDGKAVIGAGFSFSKSKSHNPFALGNDLMVVTSFLDPATGKDIKAGGERLGTPSIAGRYVLDALSCGSGFNRSKVGPDLVITLVTRVWEIGSPPAPKKVGENILVIPGFTPDISAKHFPKAAGLYPTAEMNVGHVNYQGIGFNFATDTSGLTAIGSRIYLHSPGMLICIGER